jgi:DNA-binding response OmpR family regulator
MIFSIVASHSQQSHQNEAARQNGNLEWLRGEAQLESLTVRVLAGSDRESDRVRAREAGADDYFIKPLSLGRLAVLLVRASGRK